MGGRLCCAPYAADVVLVINPAAAQEKVTYIPTQRIGSWNGIAAMGNRLYCAPSSADCVLEIDPDAQRVTSLPVKAGQRKWSGVIAMDERLYCAPCHSDEVLVINPFATDDADKISYIPTGRTGDAKWARIVAVGCPRLCDDVR